MQKFLLLTLEAASEALVQGSVVIFPTETFYALGCDAMNPDAVGGVFSLKKRALSMPLPVVIASRSSLDRLAAYVPDTAVALMDAFWPGSLSIVLPARPELPDLLTANAGRIAVRFSPHPAVIDLCRASDKILVASSANISGTPAVTRLENLDAALVPMVAGVYAAEPNPSGGLPSTVVDVLESKGGDVVRVLRSGVVSAVALRAAGFTVQEVPEYCP